MQLVQIFTKGIQAKFNELESESDISPLSDGRGRHFLISHFTLNLTHSAMARIMPIAQKTSWVGTSDGNELSYLKTGQCKW